MKFRQIAGHQSPSEGVRGGRGSRIGRVSGGVTCILQLEFGFRFQINPRVFCCCTAFLPAHPSPLGFRLRVLCFHCFNSVNSAFQFFPQPLLSPTYPLSSLATYHFFQQYLPTGNMMSTG